MHCVFFGEDSTKKCGSIGNAEKKAVKMDIYARLFCFQSKAFFMEEYLPYQVVSVYIYQAK